MPWMMLLFFSKLLHTDEFMINEKKFIDHFLEANGTYGYGDPDARRDDDRKITIILNKQQLKMQEQQIKTQKQLNWITFMLVIIGIVNIFILCKP